ncbi:multiprotein-bridging factor 1 family protein [Hydrogenophaga bisanensis]|uniref:Multiprotein-bridging factor 1 family protein n=1 Tax=Hydrogenophaga bisanensis TaxID=439611 RepID=A0ABW2REN8_9BURK
MAAQHPKKTLLDPDTGSRLKEARERAGMSQAALANLAQITRFTQAGYESGATEPNTGYLRRIEAAGLDPVRVKPRRSGRGRIASAGGSLQSNPFPRSDPFACFGLLL